MFSLKLTHVLIASSLALVVAAVPGGWGGEPTKTVTVTATPTATSISECNTDGGAQCCQDVGNAGSSGISSVLAELGIVVQDVDGLVGINCDPITVGKSCSNTPVCCEDNAIDNLVSVGCVVL
ncbi:fungal hydrophobin [Daedalea quercina L-15889]|uniref:Hydrophobin n=1 Tax=Daedalea quercina L-15889 TaxID=1314783 RepID=A0A165RCX9_9APHY|nr:fungal hydrophobin [Daedalea quercina L-15889]